MLARIRSAALLGIDAFPVDVEIDIANGLPAFSTVGLAQGAVREGRERVTAAIVNSGYQLPLKRITVNLAPADVKKDGSGFDLPVAVGILVASGQIEAGRLDEMLLVGELGLEGDLRPVRGALSVALGARLFGLPTIILPHSNLAEAAVVDGVAVLGARSLGEVCGHLAGNWPLPRGEAQAVESADAEHHQGIDYADVRGQAAAKRALEVAAAGGHNILMIGPPGSGKTMLARRLPTILPAFTLDEALEATRIHSVAGLLPPGRSLLPSRPFRAPHHTISDAGLIGGGSTPRPGEVSLAHGGVLFLDELPEFRRNVLEVLRQPLEDGTVTLSRAAVSLTYPARFTLAAAMNPCPCGQAGDPARACRCDPVTVERYFARLSGPLLDRVDIHLRVPALAPAELSDAHPEEPSGTIRQRVARARERQRERFTGRGWLHANAHMGPRELQRYCPLDREGARLLGSAMSRLGLSARAFHRVIKLARTIADLEGADSIESSHLAEAIQYRSLDRARSGVGG